MTKCSEQVTGYWGSNFMRTRQCKCAATVVRAGKPFCWRHDPETLAERQAAQKKKSQEAWEAKRPLKMAMYQASLRAKAARKAAKT